MIVRCNDCNASYSVDDRKVAGKKFAFDCPKCGAHNIFDNTAQSPEIAVEMEPEEQPFGGSEGEVMEEERLPSDVDEMASIGDEIDAELSGIGVTDEELPMDEELHGEMVIGDVGGPVIEEEGAVDAGAARKDEDFDLGDVTIYDSSTEADRALGEAGLESEIVSFEGEEDADIDIDIDAVMAPEEDTESPEAVESLDIDEGIIEIEGDESTEGLSLDDALDTIDVSSLRSHDEEPADMLAEEEESLEGEDLTTAEFEDFQPLEEDMLTEPQISGEPYRVEMSEVSGESGGVSVEPTRTARESDVKTEEVLSADSSDLDESVTLDLDSLDIQLEEDAGEEILVSREVSEVSNHELDTIISGEASAEEDDDESITIDLASLDIPLEEEEEIRGGEALDEDERLTLEDAGLTMDELEPMKEAPEALAKPDLEGEEDIRLSIDEIDPSLSVDKLIEEVEETETLLADELSSEELPEIDIEKFTGEVEEPVRGLGTDDYLDIEQREDRLRYPEMVTEEKVPTELVPHGLVNVSIDYSLKFTRWGALFRLLGLFFIRLLPHVIVVTLYSLLSTIVGAMNWLVITLTGQSVEDFTEIQEKTIRYILSLSACMVDVIEDAPLYTGTKDIDYSLQLDIVYPVNYSRLLAFLRLTGIGIIILALPHILILSLLTIGSVLICFIGLISVLATGRWPNVFFDFMIRYYRYVANVLTYLFGVVDKYPTFRFE